MQPRNPYEAAARSRKVLKILAAVPAGETAEEITRIADWLASRTQDERNALAAWAGVNAPSETTWNEVVQVQRWRRPSTPQEAMKGD